MLRPYGGLLALYALDAPLRIVHGAQGLREQLVDSEWAIVSGEGLACDQDSLAKFN